MTSADLHLRVVEEKTKEMIGMSPWNGNAVRLGKAMAVRERPIGLGNEFIRLFPLGSGPSKNRRRLNTMVGALRSSEPFAENTSSMPEKKRFLKKFMVSDHLGESMKQSSLVLFVGGKYAKTEQAVMRKRQYSEIGFTMKHVKGSTFVCAARNYEMVEDGITPEDRAKAIATGPLTLVMYTDPLITLIQSKKLDALEKLLPLKPPKKGKEGAEKGTPEQDIIGAYINDHGKSNANIWLDKLQLVKLLDEMKEISSLLPTPPADDMETQPTPHSLYQTQIASTLLSTIAGITQPFEQQLHVLPNTLHGILANVDLTFSNVLAQKEQQQKEQHPV